MIMKTVIRYKIVNKIRYENVKNNKVWYYKQYQYYDFVQELVLPRASLEVWCRLVHNPSFS